ncbi:MAG TPA: dihydrofolate reductase family protein [Aldersonia sp.]
MRDLTYYVACSIDGFIAAPDGSYDPFLIDGDHTDTIVAEYPETLPVHARAALGIADAPNRQFDTVLMGRRTFEPTLAAGLVSPYPHLRQDVFSTTLPDIEDPSATVVRNDADGFVRDLKRGDGLGIWLCGGSTLAGALLSEIDRLIVKQYAVVFGAGLPMFAHGYDPRGFELLDTRVHDNGAVFRTYRATGG